MAINKAICFADHGGVFSQTLPAVCGDGVVDPGEVCDQGANNSDSRANACRTDCRAYYCGDGVLDSGEECDSGQESHSLIGQSGFNTTPNGCRNGCKLPVCGDGIRDNGTYTGQYAANKANVFSEECDDGNSNELDGCKSDCTTCLQLSSNIDVTSNTKLCGQLFNVADYGDEGVLIAKFPGVIIDCDGATLQGTGVGVGIYVKMANDVTIRNCTITGYAVGVKVVDSQNVQFLGNNNRVTGNGKPLLTENSHLTPPVAPTATTGVPTNLNSLQVPANSNQPQKQGTGKMAPGVAPQVQPAGTGGRIKPPTRKPRAKKPGQPTPPRGSKSTAGKARSTSPAQLGGKTMPPDPLDKKRMPVDPYGKGNKATAPVSQGTPATTAPLAPQTMPIDPWGKGLKPTAPAVDGGSKAPTAPQPQGVQTRPVAPLKAPEIQMMGR
ncbi:MAG: hypothetical protein ABFR97_08660 [Thermodesulfobacteriota bacterium]